jgi:hypothetical protein
MATQQDQEAVAKFFVGVFTLGMNHAYRAARLTYGRTIKVRIEKKRAVKAVRAERVRRYAALGIVPRDRFDN